jgi:serine/threonine-protein kinase
MSRDDAAGRWRRLTEALGAELEAVPEARGGFLEQPALALAAPLLVEATAERSARLEGTLIGPYRILRELARGGMGTVYLAERADGQFEQRVALKLIKRGMDSDEIHRRFLAERQILARLSHPHIARLLDGGVSGDGQPYFAMEYVDGMPLTSYCDAHHFGIGERLRLFSDVCRAVRHAHQNLVIHRDLKPSNIMATAEGQVKLLDFGIAKLVEQEGAASTALTEVGVRAMTPEYAAPEQVRGEPVTTATDVYALGAILYEVLTGHRAHRFQRHTLDELEHVVCEEAPQAPSTAVIRTEEISLADGTRQSITPAAVSLARGTEPERLRRQLGGDLDTIVLKALQKVPGRRYSSADALLADLQRYTAGLPVLARPDSRLYRAGKFVRRHRVGVGAASGLLLALVAGLTGTAWQARVASREAAKATEVKNFVKDLFNVSTPAESRGREITARELLERGTRRVDSALARQPDVQLELLDFLGQVHRDLGYYPAADTLLRRAIDLARRLHGAGGLAEANELATWGTVLLENAEYDRADSILTRALAIQQTRGERDSVVARTLSNLASVKAKKSNYPVAEARYREALALDRSAYGEDDPETAEDMNSLGVTLYYAGKPEEADSVERAALAILRRHYDPGHPEVLAVLHDLAQLTVARGDLEGAERLQREVVTGKRRLYPQGHPDLAISLWQLEAILEARGKYVQAESVMVETLEMRRRLLGPESPLTVALVAQLGVLDYRMGKLPEAEAATREALGSLTRSVGVSNADAVVTRNNLGAILSDEGKYQEADTLIRGALALRRRIYGDSAEDVAASLRNLGILLHREHRDREAERSLREAVVIYRKALPAGHPRIAEVLTALGTLLIDQKRFAEAEPGLREALAIRNEKLGTSDLRTAETESLLGACLAGLRRNPDAEPLLIRSYQTLRASPYSGKELNDAARRLADYYESSGRRAEAARLLRTP